ncbi:Mu-like prophage major head subunit gpT family protein [Marivibrio halodurans]|uniref:Mu-like prophage major head subunit gpT family protein n=1 Tax=Marivibrio halodurans TaxID=2039722 RepID=A0A8J7S8E5_9PROT|nr:Mu-like prophage major head subunit gpT family protein [Marivibrio halodurans]MBP5857287.1 Mu-like prophage major head subunit gpT family protein [Marivibrio halodurans]
MRITAQNLESLRRGFNAAFQRGLGQAAPQSDMVATTVTSTTSENVYGWLGKVPSVREWIGPRVVQNIAEHDYAIKNKPWELTIGVDKDDIEDDNLGIYPPLFEEMGRSTQAHKETLVFDLLKAGFTTPCYDGQNYFDTDHPVLDADGNEISVANTDGGSGSPWFLIDDSRSLKPIIFQSRRAFEFVAKDRPTDDNVFDLKEFRYGVDGRNNVGFGFWQFAWGSKQDLTASTYATGRAALLGMKGDYGRPLGIMPKALVVGPSLEGKANEILNAERDTSGATNVWKGTAKVVVVPWLA